MKKRDLTTEERISAEKKRLSVFYKDMDKAKKGIAAGLIERASFMRIQCEDLEEDLLENGWTDVFQQSERVPPYDRARPQGQAYQTLNANYQKIIKQLDSMLPPHDPGGKEGDDFDDFADGR